MAISYEEALETLQAMFGEPWTRQSLDAVLRHEKGHMENTCELILQHGEKDPQILVERLESGHTTNRENNTSTSNSNSNNNNQQVGGSGHSKIGRGISTTLPEVFLRLPGYQPPPSSMLLSGPGQQQQQQQQQPMDDETLARMLQDELFSEELARNPDFAHLAGGHGQQRRTRYNSGRRSTTGGASNARLPAAQAGPPLQNPFEGVNVMQKISSEFVNIFVFVLVVVDVDNCNNNIRTEQTVCYYQTDSI